jgi:protein O-mannosyl-transferase
MKSKAPNKAPQSNSSQSEMPADHFYLDPSPWYQRYAVYLFAALGMLAYANTLAHGFVLDDPLILSQNKYVTRGLSGIPDLIFKSYRADVADGAATGFLYRPLSPVVFAVEWALGGGSPILFHVMSVLCYGVVCALAYKVFRVLFGAQSWCLAVSAGLLFVLHPIHTEVVANIKSRDEIFALLFSLGAIYGWHKWRGEQGKMWLYVSLTSLFLATLAKESAVTVFPVFALLDWCFYRKSAAATLKSIAIASIPILMFLGLRAYVYSGFVGAQSFDIMDNAIVGASGWPERSSTGFMVFFQYIKMLFVPYPLVSDYSFNHMPLVQWPHVQSILGFVLFVGIAAYGLYATSKRMLLGAFLLAFLGSILLYTQLITVIGTLFAERLAFAPSFWFCGVFVLIFSHFLSEKTILICSLAVGLLFLWFTWQRNTDWTSNLTLFTADTKTAPKSVRLHNGIAGETYQDWVAQGKKPEQLPKLIQTLKSHSEAALALRPNPISHINLGLAALEEKQYALAEKQFQAALVFLPNYQVAKQNLIVTYLNWGRDEARVKQNLPEAIRIFEALLGLGYQGADVLQDLGTAYAMSGQPAKAIPYFEQCIAKGVTDPTLTRNLDLCRKHLGQK